MADVLMRLIRMNIQVVALCLAHHAAAAQSEPNIAETRNTAARAEMYGANVHGHMFGTVGTGRPRGEHPSQCVLETCDG